MKKILILNGHPDGGKRHYCDVIVKKYQSAARAAKHEVEVVRANELEFELLGSKQEFDRKVRFGDIEALQQKLLWADHFVIVYPLWMGDMPALLKGVFEQLFRPGYAIPGEGLKNRFDRPLAGKSARIIVTMGMPGVVYNWFYKAHTLKSLKRNILDFAGFTPVRSTVIGKVFKGNEEHLKLTLSQISKLGQLAR